jgi:hypothetical protein
MHTCHEASIGVSLHQIRPGTTSAAYRLSSIFHSRGQVREGPSYQSGLWRFEDGGLVVDVESYMKKNN